MDVYGPLLAMQDLMVSQDRYGLFRPVKVAGDPEKTNDKWRTSYSLHWDVSILFVVTGFMHILVEIFVF